MNAVAQRTAILMTGIFLLMSTFSQPWASGAQTIDSSDKLYKIAFTNGEGFAPRSQPKRDSEEAIYGEFPEGTEVIIECETEGETVNNNFSDSNIWARMYDGLYIPNSFIHTGIDGRTPGVPTCNELDSLHSGEVEKFAKQLEADSDRTTKYDGEKAARWAVENYNHPKQRRFEYNCTWFASQALWEGGLPKSDIWTDISPLWKRKIPNPIRHGFRGVTLEARSVQHFQDYMSKSWEVEKHEINDWSDNSLGGKVRVGDVITYDYSGDGEVDHAAIVTQLTDEGYPKVTEVNDSGTKKPNRFWSWSLNKNTWIKDSYPNAKAYLLHIR